VRKSVIETLRKVFACIHARSWPLSQLTSVSFEFILTVTKEWWTMKRNN